MNECFFLYKQRAHLTSYFKFFFSILFFIFIIKIKKNNNNNRIITHNTSTHTHNTLMMIVDIFCCWWLVVMVGSIFSFRNFWFPSVRVFSRLVPIYVCVYHSLKKNKRISDQQNKVPPPPPFTTFKPNETCWVNHHYNYELIHWQLTINF